MKTLSKKTILLALLAVIVLGFFVFTPSPWGQSKKTAKVADEPKPKEPSIFWTSDHLNIDGDDTVSVTLTTQSPIPATQIEIVPELSPYLSVSPQTLPALAKGATQTLQVAAKVPTGTSMDTIDGTIHVRLGSSTIARPLPITLKLWAILTNVDGGFSVSVPPAYTSRAFSSTDPLSGQPIPQVELYLVNRDGCEQIFQLTVYQPLTPISSLDDIVIDSDGSSILSRSFVNINGQNFLRTVVITPGGRQIVYQLLRNGKIAEVTVHECTPEDPTFQNEIDGVLSSIQFNATQ